MKAVVTYNHYSSTKHSILFIKAHYLTPLFSVIFQILTFITYIFLYHMLESWCDVNTTWCDYLAIPSCPSQFLINKFLSTSLHPNLHPKNSFVDVYLWTTMEKFLTMIVEIIKNHICLTTLVFCHIMEV